MRSRISRPVAPRSIPARETHLHAGCGHGCDCYAPSYDNCRECRSKEANDLKAAEYAARQKSD